MKFRQIISVLLAIMLLLCGCTQKTEDNIIIKTEHCSITPEMLQYIYYYNYYDLYAADVDYYGFDTGLSFAEQLYSEGVSWYQHLSELALAVAKRDILLKEAGLAAGFEYEADTDSVIADQTRIAMGQGMTLEEYYRSYYGEGITEDAVRQVLSIQLYASAYGDTLKENYGTTLTDTDYAEYYQSNKMAIEIVDVLTYSIPINYNGVINTEKLGSLLNCKTEEEFKSWIAADLTEKNQNSDTPKSPEELAAKIEEKTSVVMSHYTEGGEFSEWAFAEGTELYETHYTEKNTGMYEVYMLLRKPYAQERYTHNLGVIKLTPASYATEEDAATKASEIIAELNQGGGGMAAFEELWNKYGENKECFLYNTADNFFETDESTEWLRAERKEGDMTAFVTDDGYYILFYAGRGQQRWVAETTEALCDAYYTDLLSDFEKQYSDSLTVKDNWAELLPDSLPLAP